MSTLGKSESRWNEAVYKTLVGILVDISTQGGNTSIKTHQEKIMAGIEANGFDFTWEAIRYVDSPPFHHAPAHPASATRPATRKCRTNHIGLFHFRLVF